jgi:hypothetical protein
MEKHRGRGVFSIARMRHSIIIIFITFVTVIIIIIIIIIISIVNSNLDLC